MYNKNIWFIKIHELKIQKFCSMKTRLPFPYGWIVNPDIWECCFSWKALFMPLFPVLFLTPGTPLISKVLHGSRSVTNMFQKGQAYVVCRSCHSISNFSTLKKSKMDSQEKKGHDALSSETSWLSDIRFCTPSGRSNPYPFWIHALQGLSCLYLCFHPPGD